MRVGIFSIVPYCTVFCAINMMCVGEKELSGGENYFEVIYNKSCTQIEYFLTNICLSMRLNTTCRSLCVRSCDVNNELCNHEFIYC